MRTVPTSPAGAVAHESPASPRATERRSPGVGVETAARRWELAAYAVAAIMAAGVGACIWGIPLPVADFTTFLFEFQQESLLQTLVKRLYATNYFRPLFFVQFKLQYDLSFGHYALAFRGVQVLHLLAIVLLVVRFARVRSATRFVAMAMALMVLLGMHTIINGFREGPLTVLLVCALAMNLAFGERPSLWRDAAAVLALVYAAFSVELGLIVWVIYVAAWLVGCRGVSRAAVVSCSAVIVAYFGLRFLVFDPGGADLLTRRIDGGAVGGRPLLFYVHNVAASVLTVLFSEPRNGVWEFARRAARGELAPWLWINLVTSALTTACLLWYVVMRRAAWRSRVLTREDRVVLVFLAVLGGNAAFGFAYTKDVMLSPAGLVYALAVCVVFEAMFLRLRAARIPVRLLTLAVLATVSLGWSVRTIGLTYVLRETAFVRRNEWAGGLERLTKNGQIPADPRARALVLRLRHDGLAAHTPNPWLSQAWAEKYFDRAF
jgi:hypothetical protein